MRPGLAQRAYANEAQANKKYRITRGCWREKDQVRAPVILDFGCLSAVPRQFACACRPSLSSHCVSHRGRCCELVRNFRDLPFQCCDGHFPVSVARLIHAAPQEGLDSGSRQWVQLSRIPCILSQIGCQFFNRFAN
jgi:hypothetical protein